MPTQVILHKFNKKIVLHRISNSLVAINMSSHIKISVYDLLVDTKH